MSGGSVASLVACGHDQWAGSTRGRGCSRLGRADQFKPVFEHTGATERCGIGARSGHDLKQGRRNIAYGMSE